MSWPKVTLIECPRGGHAMVAEDGFCEHCAEADMEREGRDLSLAGGSALREAQERAYARSVARET